MSDMKHIAYTKNADCQSERQKEPQTEKERVRDTKQYTHRDRDKHRDTERLKETYSCKRESERQRQSESERDSHKKQRQCDTGRGGQTAITSAEGGGMPVTLQCMLILKTPGKGKYGAKMR